MIYVLAIWGKSKNALVGSGEKKQKMILVKGNTDLGYRKLLWLQIGYNIFENTEKIRIF